MPPRIVAMIHVPDVKATADWYGAIGFTLVGWNPDDEIPGAWNWAGLRLGDAELMLNAGGAASDAWRREVDLYVHCEDLESEWERLRTVADIVEPPHDTEYGQREFIIRDLNRFWITFGQPMTNPSSA